MTLPLAYQINEAAKIAGIGRTKLYEAIRDGHLIARKYGKRTLIEHDALKAFLGGLPAIAPPGSTPTPRS